MFQLDLFENDENYILKEEIVKLRASHDKVRRSLFAKHGQLANNYLELLNRIDIIERNICRETYADRHKNAS